METEEADPRFREPKQERSRRRVERLLEAAERILTEDGFEALTLRRLTREAGIAMGTVYQFFADKDAIVQTLAARYIEEEAAQIEGNIAKVAALPLDARVSGLIDLYIAKYRTSPGFRAIWAGGHLGPELQRADDANDEALIRAGLGLLAPEGEFDLAGFETAVRVAVYAHEGLIHRAFRDHPDGDEALLQESKVLVELYLENAAERFRILP